MNSYQDIQTMTLFIGGYFGPNNQVVFNLEKGTYAFSTYTRMSDSYEKKGYFSASKLLAHLESCQCLDWDESYENEGILDGMHWTLEISFKSRESFESGGSNNYPDSFKTLCGVISRIIKYSFS
ncbi:TPA: hypothetical protein ACGO1T_001705 [Streptococcus suis]